MMFPKAEVDMGRNTTAREFVLEAKIRELIAELHLHRMREASSGVFRPSDESVFEPPTVDLSAYDVTYRRIVDWSIDKPSPYGGLHMVGRYSRSADGPEGGVSYMVSDIGLYRTEDKIQLLGALHEQALHLLAKSIRAHHSAR